MRSLRETRARAMLSQRALAARAGVALRTIAAIEAGENVPTFQTMTRLCEALRVKPDQVMEFAAAIEQRGKDAA